MKRTPFKPSTKPLKRTRFKGKKHKQTKATNIPQSVKREVWERDLYSCVWTGEPVPVEYACAHFIRRSHGGLGIPQNILTLSPEAHERFDNGTRKQREEMRVVFWHYLQRHYPCLKEEDLIYKKA